MSENADALQSPTLPLPPPKNGFQRVIGVIFSPIETFEDIARKPDVLIPLLLIIVVTLLGIGLTKSHMDWDAMVAQQQEMAKARNPNVSQAQLDQMAGFQKVMSNVGIWFSPVFIIAGLLIGTAILMLAFKLFGGQGSFMQCWAAVMYAWIPRIIQQIVGVAVVMTKGKINPMDMPLLVKSNPGFLVNMKEHAGLFSILSSFDVFVIWYVILLIIGFAAATKVSRAKSASIIVSLWLLLVLVKGGIAAVFGGMAKR